MNIKFFKLASQISKKSNHPKHKIGGILVKKKRVISIGFNKYKTHSKSNHPYKNIHCELDCILGIDLNILNGSSIYLYRETKDGRPALSKPCKWCEQLLKNVGISRVYYTNNGSYYEEEY